jgi:hypothetical protein
MSTRAIYKCDRCGKEQETAEQFWTVAVMATTGQWSYPPSIQQKKEWCRKCLDEMNVLGWVKEPTLSVPAPTFEDLIREIVRETIDQEAP